MQSRHPAPASEPELLARARALAGRTLEEVAEEAQVAVPAGSARAKGFIGMLLEHALGAENGSNRGPDFPRLGIELKTVPVSSSGCPRESTFVCTVPMTTIADIDWEESPVRAKLRRVLFVPIEAEPTLTMGARRIGTALLWSPSSDDDEALRQDWDELAGTMGRGDIDALKGRNGRYLQVRPKAATARVRSRYLDPQDGFRNVLPRGFYLRAAFTSAVLRTSLEATQTRAF